MGKQSPSDPHLSSLTSHPYPFYIPRMHSRRARLLPPSVVGLLVLLLSACMEQDTTVRAVEAIVLPPKPDSFPQMLNEAPPFRYPSSLYDRKVQGNVMLRLYIDSTGRVWPESTLVNESSGYPELDSAAVRGSGALHFKPAMKAGAPMPVRVAFPVFFRHPDAQALPGDTVLRQPGTGIR